MKRGAQKEFKKPQKRFKTTSLAVYPSGKTLPRSLVFQANTVKNTPELKEHLGALPTAMGAFGATTFSSGQLLNALHQGATAATRIGRKVALRSILVRYSVALAPTSTGGSPARILIVYDKQANGAAPAITDILIGNDFHAPNNLNNSDRFITLFDEISEPISTQNNYSASKVLYRKLGLETIYKDSDAGDITDIITGSIYAFVANNSAIGVATGAVASITRIRFNDQ